MTNQKTAIVGGGISGLVIAYLLHRQNPQNEIFILEQGNFGGPFTSVSYQGTVIESGSAFVDTYSEFFIGLCQQLGLGHELVLCKEELTQYLLKKDGGLYKIPRSRPGLLFSSLLLIASKIKALRNYNKVLPQWSKTSIFEVFRNIGGVNFGEIFGSALSRYHFHSEAEDVEFAAAFPEIFESLTTGTSLKQARHKTSLAHQNFLKQRGFAENPARYATLKSGLSLLTKTIKETLQKEGQGKVAFENQKILRLLKTGNKYQLQSRANRYNDIDRVIFTVPPQEMSQILREFDKNLAQEFAPFSTISQTIVYASWQKKHLQTGGAGFYIPRREKQNILGCLFLSNIFPQNYDAQQFVTRSVISGDTSLFSEEEAANLAIDNLQRILGTKENPLWFKTIRHQDRLPRYAKGHFDRCNTLNTEFEKFPNLFFCGWHYRGFSLGESIYEAYLLTERLKK